MLWKAQEIRNSVLVDIVSFWFFIYGVFLLFFCWGGGATSFSLYSFHISWLNVAVSSKRTFNGITVPPVGTELAASTYRSQNI